MDEDIIVVGIVFGSFVAIVVISLLYSLIKASIKNKKGAYDEETFNRMAQAFIKHRKKTERRLKDLEAIVASDEKEREMEKIEFNEPEKEETLEIEDEKPKEKKDENEDGNLKNILREK